jgi:DNA-binding NtrC family response regulator
MNERKGKTPLSPILVVDDEEHAIKSFELTLRSGGFNNIVPCPDSMKVYELLEQGEFELILLDLVMPELSGEEILSKVIKRFPEIPVIMVTGTNEVETAVRCMQKGAFDYVLKPVEKERLLPSIHRALEVRHLRRENAELTRRFFSDAPDQPEKFSRIITRNRKMMAIFRYCEAIAAGRRPILITGETGVGKELVAEALHKIGGSNGEFVAVNVAGLDDTMFSDTLFGHVRGAFTGAAQVRSGQIEKAVGGTLFLDEIGDLSITSQVKLLRLLDKHEYFPLGSDTAKLADARFVFATHNDLFRQTQEGKFREDLLYRLRTHHVHLPPLRERLDDIPMLLDYFIDDAAQEFSKKTPGYPQELITLLQTYHFPGNVRELKSLVFDAVGRGGSKILSTRSFEDAIQGSRATPISSVSPQASSKMSWFTQLEQLPTIKEATETLIQESLNRAKNNQRVAAMMLGITPQALNQRLKRQS